MTLPPLRTIIIDDEPIALEKLRSYVEKTPGLALAGACQNGFDALDLLAHEDVDLVVTDINMPDLSGMEMVKSLAHPPMVIFTTAYPQYAVEGYKVSAVDYLLKPYGFAEFSRSAGKAIDLYRQRMQAAEKGGVPSDADASIFVKVDYRYVRVSLADIRFIKGYGEYLQIFVEGKKAPLVTLSSFASVMQRLGDNFLQVHRSYIVNMNRVLHIERNRLIMDEDNYIPVGDSYRTAFQQYVASHSIGKGAK